MENEISKIHVVHFVNEIPADGEVVDDWGGHVTIIKPFELVNERGLGDIVSAVESVGRKYRPFSLQPIGHEQVGPDDDQQDSIKIQRTPELHRLHLDLVHVFENLGIVFPDARWMRETYNPHSTIVGGVELTEPTICDSLSINMKLMGQRVVARTVMLSGSISQEAPC